MLIKKPFGIQSFTEALSEMMDNTDYWNTLSKNSRIASEKYGVKHIVKEWYHVIGIYENSV